MSRQKAKTDKQVPVPGSVCGRTDFGKRCIHSTGMQVGFRSASVRFRVVALRRVIGLYPGIALLACSVHQDTTE